MLKFHYCGEMEIIYWYVAYAASEEHPDEIRDSASLKSIQQTFAGVKIEHLVICAVQYMSSVLRILGKLMYVVELTIIMI